MGDKGDLDRFWSKVDTSGDCWNWTASVTKQGYGQFSIGGRHGHKLYAHRYSFELVNGDIPSGLQIDHICHNRKCVNPEHLRLATNKQNHEHYRGPTVRSTSGIRGVYWHKTSQKWQATVGHHGEIVHVGIFEHREDAEQAVIAKRNELFTHNDKDRLIST